MGVSGAVVRAVAVSVCVAVAVRGADPEGLERDAGMLSAFDYRGVALDDGPLRRQFDEVRDFYLRVPVDDLLRGYRVRAGLPAPGRDPGGNTIGHNTFGQVLSGLARMFAATGDPACLTKAQALLSGWEACIEPDGFFFIDRNPQLPPYYYDKMVGGLVDCLVYAGLESALVPLARITDWAEANLDRARLYARPTGEGGGEWYTLSENLYRAYLATGDARYRDFAGVWEYTEFWDLFGRGDDVFAHPMNGGWYHAYSHVNSLNGLALAYRVRGDAADLDALRNAYDFLWNTQLWVTGGYGPNETLMPREDLARMLVDTVRHFETQCGSWAVFKLGKNLITLTGDARYGDWIELVLLNGIGASIPMDPDGSVFYYSEYHLGGSAKRNMAPWACCSGTRIQAVADFHDLIYFQDPAGLYVNLYAPSTVTWDRGESTVRVQQRTGFPGEDSTELAVACEPATDFALHLRVPGWLAGPMRVFVNDVPVDVDVERNWAVVQRRWGGHDRVRVELPMAFSWSRIRPGAEYPAALRYGPVALVSRSERGNPARTVLEAAVPNDLEPVPGDPLNFRPHGDGDVLVRPFYQMKEGERYFLYLDPENPVTRIPYEDAVFHPQDQWHQFDQWRATNTVGAAAEYTFQGERITVLGQRYDDAGRMEVTVDGVAVGTIDQYGPHRGEPARWEFAELGPGPHTLVLTLLPDANPESKGRFVNLFGFEVVETATPGM